MSANTARLACASAVGLLLVATGAGAQPALQRANVVEHLGAAVPGDVRLVDETGQPVSLSSLIGTKPVVLSLAYFNCPMLCPLEQQGMADALRDSGWRIGPDFRAVTVSIDPSDTPAVARQWRARTAARLGVPADGLDWHYLVGRQPEIRRLADAVGFEYARDPESGQFSHAAVLFVIGADGRIAQYLYGISFAPKDVADALSAARSNATRSTAERFLMRCYHYIPSLRRHGGLITWTLRFGGGLVTATLGIGLVVLWRRERSRL